MRTLLLLLTSTLIAPAVFADLLTFDVSINLDAYGHESGSFTPSSPVDLSSLVENGALPVLSLGVVEVLSPSCGGCIVDLIHFGGVGVEDDDVVVDATQTGAYTSAELATLLAADDPGGGHRLALTEELLPDGTLGVTFTASGLDVGGNYGNQPIASAIVIGTADADNAQVSALTYTFSESDTPEPGSFLLFGTVAIILWRVLARRSQNERPARA
jgi:hypothetical protein